MISSNPTRRRLLIGLWAMGATGCVPARGTTAPVAADGTMSLDGGPAFAELIRGRVAVVDFWATWCEPCRVSIPKVIAFAARQQPGDVVVVGVHVGQGFESAMDFARDAGIAYPLFADPEYRLSGAMGADRVPTIVVLDRAGAVVLRTVEIDATVDAAVTRGLQSRSTRA